MSMDLKKGQDLNNQIIETSDIIKESSYLFYEMKDIERKVKYNNTDLSFHKTSNVNEPKTISISDIKNVKNSDIDINEYTIYISPLFAEEVIDAPFNEQILSVIFEETPFYYLEPNIPVTEYTQNISHTRDIGEIDTPSVLQTPFWETWYRECQGFITNKILLSIFNKLKYPFIDENQYLNANLFPELALKAFKVNDTIVNSDLNEQPIKFKTEVEPGSQDELFIKQGTEINCADYLNDIVLQKLSANQSLINYNPDQANLLSCWSESKYQSGMISAGELEREKTIYKLQDTQYELLRRKFAGSSTLYNIALASINRRGSFIRTVAVGDVNTSTSGNEGFRDTRFVRVLNIPGILTSTNNVTSMFPFEYLYEDPYKEDGYYIPMDLLTPLFYTSAPQDGKKYDSEKFYITGETLSSLTEDKITVQEYRALRLRDNSDVIEWSNPSSPLSNEDYKEIYHKLDTPVKEIPDKDDLHKKLYRQLDIEYYLVDGPQEGEKIKVPNILDYKTSTITSNVTTGSVLDVSMDSLLYHENTIQKKDRISYPYLTYPIADGNSVSLMDTAWMNYLQDSTEQKSKVSDNISFGAQVSYYNRVTSNQKFENYFFALSYGDDTYRKQKINENNIPLKDNKGNPIYEEFEITAQSDIPILSYEEFRLERGKLPKYAYLWMCTINADVETFKVHADILSNSDIKLNLISKITLRIDSPLDKSSQEKNSEDPYKDVPLSEFKGIDILEDLTNYNIGILPLTYGEIQGDKAANLKFGIYKNKENEYKLYDDISDLNFSRAYYIFTSSDIINHVGNVTVNPSKDVIRNISDIELIPSNKVKSLYFVIKKPKNNKIEYTWSEAIPVINFSKENEKFLNGDYKLWPDWYGLCYHLNPELNYNKNSASSIFNKDAIKAPFIEKTSKGVTTVETSLINNLGSTQFTALSNLNRTHNLEFLCNDDGIEENVYIKKLTDIQLGPLNPLKSNLIEGFYLDYYHVAADNPDYSQVSLSNVDVFGDNRFSNILDGHSSRLGSKVERSLPYESNILNKYSLHFEYPSSKAISPEVPFLYNYYELKPKRGNCTDTDWNKWWWNKTFDNTETPEITVCFNFQLNGKAIKSLFEESDATPKYTMLLAERKKEFEMYIEIEDSSIYIPEHKSEETTEDYNKRLKLIQDRIKSSIEGAYFKVYFKITEEGGLERSIHTLDDYFIPYTESYETYRLTGSYGSDKIETVVREEIKYETKKIKVKNEDYISPENLPLDIRADVLAHPENVAYADYYKKFPQLNNPKANITDENIFITETIEHKIPTIEVTFNSFIRLLLNNEFREISCLENQPKAVGINKIDYINEDGSVNYLHEISLFSRVNKITNWQTDIFYGDILDFRLYNIGFPKEQLLLLNRGLLRELYSYSSSNMKLGYHIYKDLGIFKIKDTLSTRAQKENKLPVINTIRLFNRNKWNTILVDPYPVSINEVTNSKAQYRVDSKDPINDSDIFEIVLDEGTQEPKGLLKDCIEQELAPNIEANNGQAPSEKTVLLNYKGFNYRIDPNDQTTIITTSLYPMEYNKQHFISGADIILDSAHNKISTEINGPIDLPVSPVSGSLEYQADIELNFELGMESDFSVWLDKGKNIQRIYQPTLKKSIATLKESSTFNLKNTENPSQLNHILIPMIIPPQTTIIDDSVKGYLDRFILKDVTLNKGLIDLLKATSYYNEMRIPVAQNLKTKENLSALESSAEPTASYISKWSAIRSLREGAYYVTCKYPFQIISFLDDQLSSSSSKNASYTTHYGAVRFKILVKGSPVEFDNSYDIDLKNNPFPEQYLRNNIDTTLKSGLALCNPEDNRSFPHRKLDIDLFVMNNKSLLGEETAESKYNWELIATNHKEDYRNKLNVNFEKLQVLDKESLSKSFCITNDLPLFITNNYNAPYFIAGDSSDTSINRKIAKADVSDPIRVEVFRTQRALAREKLNIENKDDLNNQCLISGRSYKLLWDYNAKISEINYLDSSSSTTNTYLLEGTSEQIENQIISTYANEKKDYARAVDILDSLLVQDYSNFIYDGISIWHNVNNYNITGNTSGFESTNGSWKSVGSNNDPINSKYYFGNPYSKSSASNYLYQISDDRQDLNNLAYFPYTPTNVMPGSICPGIYDIEELPTLNRSINGKALDIDNDLRISEEEYLELAWNRMKINAINSINLMKNSSSGIFSGISYIKPKIQYKKAGGSFVHDTKETVDICTNNSELYAYAASDRHLNISNNLNVQKVSLYKNNLFNNQDFDNALKWKLSHKGEYVTDSNYDIENDGKDVYRVTLKKNAEFTMKFCTGSRLLTTNYEIAFVAKSDTPIKVEALFYEDNIIKGDPLILSAKEVAQVNTTNYSIYSAESSLRAADTIAFRISAVSNVSEDVFHFEIAKVIVRVSDIYNHKLGLSDVAKNLGSPTSPQIILNGHNIIAYRNENSEELYPVQFKNIYPSRQIGSISNSVINVDPYPIRDFIENNKLEDWNGKKLIKLLQPWIRHIHYWEKYSNNEKTIQDKVLISKYIIEPDNYGKLKKRLAPGESQDIYSNPLFTYDGHDKITIDSMDVNLSSEDSSSSVLSKYNTNLRLNNNVVEHYIPIILTNEKFSGITNCFNLDKLIKKVPSEVAVTNIQLLANRGLTASDTTKEIIYELEYLPIIYDESKHHFSFNFFLHKLH